VGGGAAPGEGREPGQGCQAAQRRQGEAGVLGTGFWGQGWKSANCARLASVEGRVEVVPVQVPRQLRVLQGAKAPLAIFLHPYVVRQKAFG